jgi:hypothetical protein
MTDALLPFADTPENSQAALELELEGETWRVSVAGSARVGFPSDSGAPLLILHFHPSAGAPDPDQERRGREGMVSGIWLSRLSYDQILDAFQRARPLSP